MQHLEISGYWWIFQLNWCGIFGSNYIRVISRVCSSRCQGSHVALYEAQDAIWSDWKAAYAVYGRMVCHRSRELKSGDYGDD
jgi:hypothetical protein